MGLSKAMAAGALAFALVGAACSSSDDDSGSAEKARSDEAAATSAPTTTTVLKAPADPEAAKTEISGAYTKAFSIDATDEEKLALVADSEDLVEAMAGVTAAIPPGASLQFDDIAFSSATDATVTLTVLLDGKPVVPGFIGTAELEDGVWKVSRKGFCDLAIIASVTCPA